MSDAELRADLALRCAVLRVAAAEADTLSPAWVASRLRDFAALLEELDSRGMGVVWGRAGVRR